MSDSGRSKVFAVSLIITNNLFFLLHSWFWEGQSIKGQNLQITDCVLNEHFQNCCSSVKKLLRTGGHSRFPKSFYPRPQRGLRYMWQAGKANQRAGIRKNCHRNRWLTSTKHMLKLYSKVLFKRQDSVELLNIAWYNKQSEHVRHI